MKKYLEFPEIEKIINDLIKINDFEIDKACGHDFSYDKIERLAIQRCAYKKVLNLLIGGISENEENNEQ